MKVIGCGLPKTGTASLTEALNILGYKCHHGFHVHTDVKKMQFWVRFASITDSEERRRMLAEYFSSERWTACMDFPSAAYFDEVMDCYPDAVVILSVRDPESWFRSRYAMLQWEAGNMRRWLCRLLALFHMRYMLYAPLIDSLEKYVYGWTISDYHRIRQHVSDPEPLYRDAYLKTFDAHNAAVIEKCQQTNTPHLIFSVKDGWEPLCRFLDVPIPDEPFPHVNEGLDLLEKLVVRMQLYDLVTSPLIWALATGVIATSISVCWRRR